MPIPSPEPDDPGVGAGGKNRKRKKFPPIRPSARTRFYTMLTSYRSRAFWAVCATVCALLMAPSGAQNNWLSRQRSHVRTTKPLDINDMIYFADDLKSENNFATHLANILIPRVPDTPGSAKVREYISATLRELDWDVQISEHTQNTPAGRRTFRNVIATLDPDAPRRLVVACHYDTLIKPKGFLGMTDSAVPCAQMLNLAHTLRLNLTADKQTKHELTLQLVFFDGEEAFNKWSSKDSTYGSRNLAAKWQQTPFNRDGVNTNELNRIDAFVLLDLIGAKNPKFVSLKQETQLWYNRFVRIEKQLVRQGKLRGYSAPIFQDKKNYFARVEDDHLPFEQRGVPILHLITVPFPDVWHKSSDNANAVDPVSIENINKILRVFVAEYLQLGR